MAVARTLVTQTHAETTTLTASSHRRNAVLVMAEATSVARLQTPSHTTALRPTKARQTMEAMTAPGTLDRSNTAVHSTTASSGLVKLAAHAGVGPSGTKL